MNTYGLNIKCIIIIHFMMNVMPVVGYYKYLVTLGRQIGRHLFSDPLNGGNRDRGGWALETILARLCLDLKFHFQISLCKRRFPSHQNTSTCMEY
jgi:hypothetical protein